MSISLTSTLASIFADATGVLYPVTDKVEGGPDYRGSIEKQVKVGEGDYKTLARFDVAGWNTITKDGSKKYISISVAGGMVRGALWKNETPKGESPPDASGTLGDKENGGTVQIAARRKTFKNGTVGMRLSVYQANQGGDAAAPAAPAAEADMDFPF